MFAVILWASAANGAVSSWLSPVGTVGGGFMPGDPTILVDQNTLPHNLSLYWWVRNDAILPSLTFDTAAGTPGVIQFTDVEVFNPSFSVGGVTTERWNVPLADGPARISSNGQMITNFGAVNVNKSGMRPAHKSFDPLYDAAVDAALFARIDLTVNGVGTTQLDLSYHGNPFDLGIPLPVTFGTAVIRVIPEPSTLILTSLAAFGLFVAVASRLPR
jgi:hypothetical protein